MDVNVKKIWSWLKSRPLWARLVLVVALAVIAVVSLSSCGSTTRAVIRNNADSTKTTVSITTNNPTSWDVSPDVQIPVDYGKEKN